jgi:hypothetical protein
MEPTKTSPMKSAQKQAVAPAKPYEPTDTEKAAMQARRARRIKTPRIKATPRKAGGVEFSLNHPDQAYGHVLLMDAFGTGESDFFCELVVQLGRAAAEGPQINEQRLNFFAAVIKGIKPKDQLETMLAAQMAAVHALMMEFANRLANAGDLAWRDSAERTLNKLARTFAAQIEALKRYRAGGEQKITVHHVSVSDGGQAIVGNVSNTAVGVTEKKAN